MVRRAGEIPSPFTSELIFQFTAAHLYEWDEPKRSDRRARRLRSSTKICSSPCYAAAAWTTGSIPEAIGRVENRLRRLGRPPRTADEMAEHLRLLGDLTPSELSGPMEAFLAELRGRAERL